MQLYQNASFEAGNSTYVLCLYARARKEETEREGRGERGGERKKEEQKETAHAALNTRIKICARMRLDVFALNETCGDNAFGDRRRIRAPLSIAYLIKLANARIIIPRHVV